MLSLQQRRQRQISLLLNGEDSSDDDEEEFTPTDNNNTPSYDSSDSSDDGMEAADASLWRARLQSDSDSCSSSSSSSSEDSSSSEESEDEDYDDENVMHRTVSATRRLLHQNIRFTAGSRLMSTPPSSPETTPRNNNTTAERIDHDDDDDDASLPLPKWDDANKYKQKIIEDLKDSESHIHTIIEDMKAIHMKYGSRYQFSKFKGYMKTIMKNYDKKKGPFKDAIEPFYNRKKIKSPAYALLFTLLINKETTGVDKVSSSVLFAMFSIFYDTHFVFPAQSKQMTTEALWSSHPVFSQYPLDHFKEYHKRMIKLTDKRREQLDRDVKIFEEHMILFPRGSKTSRGKLFWDTHPSNGLLEDDTKSGKAKELKPKALWESREEYQEFDLDDFRGHIYQERSKQLAGAYWQHKLRRFAAKKHRREVRKMKRQVCQYKSNKDEDIQELVDQWTSINYED